MAFTTTYRYTSVSPAQAPTGTANARLTDMAASASLRVTAYDTGDDVRIQFAPVSGATPFERVLTERNDPSVTVLSNGRVLVTATTDLGQVTHTLYSPGGVLIRDLTFNRLNATDVEVTAQANGGYAICYATEDRGVQGVAFEIFNSAGVATSSTFITNPGFQSFAPEIATLASGGIVTVLERTTGTARSVEAYLQAADGTNLIQFTLATGQGARNPTVAAHPDGGFVVVHETPVGVRVAWYSEGGVQLSTYNIENGLLNRFHSPELSTGPDGVFLLTLQDAGTNPFMPAPASRVLMIDTNTVTGVAGLQSVMNGAVSAVFIPGSDDIAIVGGTAAGLVFAGAVIHREVRGNNAHDRYTAADDMAAVVFGGGGNDVLRGGDQNDRLLGEAGADQLHGDAGDDVLEGGLGADFLIGGAGSDTASYVSSGQAVQVLLATSQAFGGDAQGDVLSNIENLQGSNHNDLLAGDSKANRLMGEAGNDMLIGDAGDDQLIGGAGDDFLRPGEGADRVEGGAGLDHVLYDEMTTGLQLSLLTGVNNVGDVLSGIEGVIGTRHDDVIAGDHLANILAGGRGDDVLMGFDGQDQLNGSDGDDRLEGGLGDDILVGGAGENALFGGGGTDVAVFAGLREDYTLIRQGSTVIVVGSDSRDTLAGVETLRFLDGDVAIFAARGMDWLI